MQLSKHQEAVIAKLEAGQSLFLTGVAGTGKSSVLREWLKRTKKNIGVTAFTGIAASHLDGQTMHSFFGMNPYSTLDSVVNSARFEATVENLDSTDAVIIDEISMVDDHNLRLVNDICVKARMDNRPFGGIQMVFVGDMGQLAPIPQKNDEGKRDNNNPPYCFLSDTWKRAHIEALELHEIFRQGDPVFTTLLRNARFGVVTPEAEKLLIARIGAFDPEKAPQPIRLVPRRDTAAGINETRLTKVPGDMRVYIAEETGPPHAAKLLEESCLSPKELKLKVGARVMVTKNDVGVRAEVAAWRDGLSEARENKDTRVDTRVMNSSGDLVDSFGDDTDFIVPESRPVRQPPPTPPPMDPSDRRRCVNGSQGFVVSMEDRRVRVKLDNGLDVWLAPADWEVNIGERVVEGKKTKMRATRKQIPLMLAYAITQHKAQGSTLERASVDISECFSFGQAYVALSRVRSLENLNIEKPFNTKRAIRCHPEVKKFLRAMLAKAREAGAPGAY